VHGEYESRAWSGMEARASAGYMRRYCDVEVSELPLQIRTVAPWFAVIVSLERTEIVCFDSSSLARGCLSLGVVLLC
jgi:hypothetical protein